jgi:hypothetical protein
VCCAAARQRITLGVVAAGETPERSSDAAARTGAPGLTVGRRVAIEAERTVDAPIELVWRRLRDYRARTLMLGEPFGNYELHERGVGAGTVIGYAVASTAPAAIYSSSEMRPSFRLTLATDDSRSSGTVGTQ